MYERLRRVSSVVVIAIETVEQREYRLKCLGPTNDELNELKAKHPPRPQYGRTSLHTAVIANDLASVKFMFMLMFIRSGEFDVQATDQWGNTALHIAAGYDSKDKRTRSIPADFNFHFSENLKALANFGSRTLITFSHCSRWIQYSQNSF